MKRIVRVRKERKLNVYFRIYSRHRMKRVDFFPNGQNWRIGNDTLIAIIKA